MHFGDEPDGNRGECAGPIAVVKPRHGKYAKRGTPRAVGVYFEIASISAASRASVIRVGEYFRTMPLRSTKTKVGVAETP
jgi:hypothetical protein